MTRRIASFLLLTVLLSLGLYSQPQEKYLISITLDTSCDRDQLEALQLPIYHSFDNTLVAGVPLDKLERLLASRIAFTIIDEAPWSEKYYLISTRNGNVSTTRFATTRVLIADESAALIKSPNVEALNLDRSVYSCAEVPQFPHFFRNERLFPGHSADPQSDSLITSVISEVRPDSVRYFIQRLQDFGTRYWRASNRDSVATWIKQRFLAMGYTDVVVDSFLYQSTWQKNVVATLPGASAPDRVVVVGGHHDSFCSGNPILYAPGADDNASGTAAALEMARVMKRKGYLPKSTIKFMTFAAEEAGLLGSAALAQRAKASGMNITLMVNHDMISYTSKPLTLSNINVNYYSGYEHLRDATIGIVNKFTQLIPRVGGANSGGSDSYSFWSNGFPAVYFAGTEFSPFYHQPSDVISNYSMEYCAEVIRASCATVIYQASSLQSLRNVTVADIGDGASLLVQWARSADPDVVGYKIRVGRSSGQYDSTFRAADTTLTIRNLTQGIRYFIGVCAYDASDNESFITERSGTPNLKPLTPSNFSADPQWKKILLRWSANNELDLAGYNIYRTASQIDPPTKLSTLSPRDTMFIDTNVANGLYYYYSVAAVDTSHNESNQTSTIRSRAVSLDQGILLADETKGGDGSPLAPTDAQVDSFYRALLAGFKTQALDVEAQGRVNLADLGAFSTVVWHGNDLSSQAAGFASQQELRKYLGYGGKIFISSYRPSVAFTNNASFSQDFNPGEFMYDYLKIRHVESRLISRFIGATPIVGGYSPVYVDTTKTQASTNYHLASIEAITAAAGASDIYKYETNYDTTQLQGAMKGLPVGIEYLGSNFKVVVVSFPLYYMRFDQAKSLLQNVLANKFSEPLAVPEYSVTLPTHYALSQNYPNPFNPSTAIRFSIPPGVEMLPATSLRVYDVLGRQVTTLINEPMQPGTYTITFDASKLSSGVYFYRLQSGPFAETRKMLLMK